MDKNDAEKVIKDTILYANEEIERNKKRYLKRIIIVSSIIIYLLILFFIIFKYDIPVKYNDKLIEVKIPMDGGIDINVNLNNYKRVKSVLVKTDENMYDLYINVSTTVFRMIFDDNDKSDNLLRVGNGIIVDFESGELRGYIPNGNNALAINNIYYIDNLSNRVATMSDSELINYKDKVLIWNR